MPILTIVIRQMNVISILYLVILVGCVACFLECGAGSSPKMEGGCPSCTECVKDGKFVEILK